MLQPSVQDGIIPAYAGSTTSGWTGTRTWEDHPRVCGEHSTLTVMDFEISGSSPRMRGARHIEPDARIAVGIIPAYAGSTRTAHW